MAAEAHVRIIRAMDRHQDDAQVQEKACGALMNLAVNDANQVPLMTAGAHMRIIRAMDLYQDNVQVQEKACGALRNLATNNANKVTLAQAATAQIVRAMQLHETEIQLMRWACQALGHLSAHDENKVLMMQAGADVALLEVVDRDRDRDGDDGELVVNSARLALRRLAANADSRVDDSWPVLVDRLRLIRIELLDLSSWAQSAASRTAAMNTVVSRTQQRLQGEGRTAMSTNIAVLAFGTELVPLDGWKSDAGYELARHHLLPLANKQVRQELAALAEKQQQEQEHALGAKKIRR